MDYYTVKSVKAEKGTVLPEDCSLLFDNYIDCAEIDLSNADTSNARDMSCMFENCKNLRSINLSNFDTGNVKNMECMFAGCNSLTSLDLSHFTVDEYDYLFGIFDECISLKELILNESFKNARYYIDEELDIKITYAEHGTSTTNEISEQELFAPISHWGEMAKKDYSSINGISTADSVTKDNFDGTYNIELFDEEGTVIDIYTIEPKSGKGTNQNNERKRQINNVFLKKEIRCIIKSKQVHRLN